MVINEKLSVHDLKQQIELFWQLSAQKIQDLEKKYEKAKGSPVFTIQGKYTTRGWTEWTRGFQYGSAILQYDATGEKQFLEMGQMNTLHYMGNHLSHIGVHDHGFNNISTYGNLLRLMQEGRIAENEWEKQFYQLALKISGAVQASRWTKLPGYLGYVYSFNGPHSLFADTIRSMRSLGLSHSLGHVLMAEMDESINLLERLLQHLETTARYTVYYGTGRDSYDLPGRVAHESIFDIINGRYRCPNSQQGYSSFSTWTRGLAWILLGYSEQLEFLSQLDSSEYDDLRVGEINGKDDILTRFLTTALMVADFYISQTPMDGIPYWDTGAPGLVRLTEYLDRPADPFNDYEPVDSSAAAIAAQGLLRLGHYLIHSGNAAAGKKYYLAGLTVTASLLSDPYLSMEQGHQGLILHSIYHRPNGWDYIPPGSKIPCGESSMWGDYHARELVLYVQRLMQSESDYLAFYTI